MPLQSGKGVDHAPREIELKLAVAARDVPRLRRRLAEFGAGRSVDVDNVYYDTAERLLHANRMALRVRRIGGQWRQTLKTESRPGALATRGEWENALPHGRLDLALLAATPLPALLREHRGARLRPVFRTRFRRTVWHAAGGAIEIALDQGELVAGRRRLPILELELELRGGSAAALFRLALDLIGEGRGALALRPEVDSKAARGYRLAAGQAAAPAKANAAAVAGRFGDEASVDDALRRLVERATTVLLLNVAGRLQRDDPEFVHQARVAVRRIRSAARLFGKEAGWPRSYDGELRWLARRLGALRDWDVLLEQTLRALAADLPASAEALAAPAVARRRRDEARLMAALASARFTRLMLRLLRWAGQEKAGGPTLAEVAGRRLERLHRRLFAAAADFAALTVEQQHRVRIRAKRLRYALDLLAAALPQRATQRYVERLAALQDHLGTLNDAVVAAARLPGLARAAGVDAAPARRWLQAESRRYSRRAAAALSSLARRPPPWR